MAPSEAKKKETALKVGARMYRSIGERTHGFRRAVKPCKRSHRARNGFAACVCIVVTKTTVGDEIVPPKLRGNTAFAGGGDFPRPCWYRRGAYTSSVCSRWPHARNWLLRKQRTEGSSSRLHKRPGTDCTLVG